MQNVVKCVSYTAKKFRKNANNSKHNNYSGSPHVNISE